MTYYAATALTSLAYGGLLVGRRSTAGEKAATENNGLSVSRWEEGREATPGRALPPTYPYGFVEAFLLCA